MSQRIDYTKIAPGAAGDVWIREVSLGESTIEPSLGEIIKLRASQINGCAYCIDMHSKDARASGEASSDFTASWPGERRPITMNGKSGSGMDGSTDPDRGQSRSERGL